MRVLFLTVQGFESDFYGRVGRELERHGHEVEQLTVSRRASELHRARGIRSRSLPEVAAELPDWEIEKERRRIELRYGLESVGELFHTDPALADKSEEWRVRRTIRDVLALEHVLDAFQPDVLVPEVGRETPRVAAHELARARGIPTLFLFYTIFPNPLRLYVDTMHAPIVAPESLRPLSEVERAQVHDFRRAFVARDEPIRPLRRHRLTSRRLRRFAGYVAVFVRERGESPYLRPGRWALEFAQGAVRARLVRSTYSRPAPDRPYVYFPLHDTEDYKIKRVIPQFADQAPVVERLAAALPAGCDLVLKEHPLSVGQNRLALLRRLSRPANVRLVPPETSSHDLIRAADAVAVISSTVGLEALLWEKPVLTFGRPFYSGFGVTVDIESLADLPNAVSEVMSFRPDPGRIESFLYAAMNACRPGAPVLVDDSDENARLLAASLDAAAREEYEWRHERDRNTAGAR
jgi:Capsule polysaccharide biosynthesis protein